jgi:CRP-like cAMP-binding protein
MTATASALLSRTWFAADMPAEVCRRMAAIGAVHEYPGGTIVVQEGTPCREFGVVLSGRIALRLAAPGAAERTLITVDEGDVFGWSALLPSPVASATGITVGSTRVLLFERERLAAAMAADCELAAALHQRVLLAVARRLHATRLQLLDLYSPVGEAPVTMMTGRTDAPAVWAFTEHEHRELARGIDRIHDVACDVGSWVAPELAGHVRDVLAWLERDLEPHIAWEESWLYPEIDARARTPWATRAARFDHGQIRAMADRLRADERLLHEEGARERLPELRCHLFSLEALVRAHVEREERYLIPLLADDAWLEPSPTAADGGSVGRP